MKILIKGARVIDPYRGYNFIGDVAIEEGEIVGLRCDDDLDQKEGHGEYRENLSKEEISEALDKDALNPADFNPDRIIDAKGMLLTPGLIDPHVHLREPGFEYKEDIESGTRAAAAGGFTVVAAMPNTKPCCDNAVTVRYIIDQAEKYGHCKVLPIGAVTKDREGKVLSEIGLMKEAGAVALSDDGASVSNAGMLKKAMLYAEAFDLTIIDHCEDQSLSADGYMNEGLSSTLAGLRGIPAAAEDICVARDILLSEYLDIPIHIAHLSTKAACRMVREAKKRGLKVTAETAPHFISLTCEACLSFDSNFKMYPPLREESDRQAVIEAILDGTIDMMATDHAPHHSDEKECEFAIAEKGILGLETSFPIAYTFLCKEPGKEALNEELGVECHCQNDDSLQSSEFKALSLERLVEMYTKAPAKLLKIEQEGLKKSSKASIALFDISNQYQVDKEKFQSKSKNTPFHGTKLYGKPVFTMYEGRISHDLLS